MVGEGEGGREGGGGGGGRGEGERCFYHLKILRLTGLSCSYHKIPSHTCPPEQRKNTCEDERYRRKEIEGRSEGWEGEEKTGRLYVQRKVHVIARYFVYFVIEVY